MNNDINVKIHIANVAKLGGKGQWNWQQSHSVGPYWRIYWNREPGAFVRTADGEIELTPDRVVLMTPGTEYAARTIGPVQHFYVHFSVSDPFSRVQPKLFQLAQRDLTEMAERLADAIACQVDSWAFPLNLHRYLLTALLYLPASAVPPIGEHDARIIRALKLIEAHPDIDNPKLAAAVHMSVNSFLALFRNEIGEPPQTYSRRKRLADAAKLLHFGSASIDEIALNTKFCDRYHFSRAFRQEYGLPPAAYRRQAQLLQ